MRALDDLDHRLLALLRTDARLPVASLAQDLKVSRATVRSRLDRLIEHGIIQGFTVVLKNPSASNVIRAIVMIAIEGPAADRVMRRLVGFPEMRHVSTTNGRWDIVAELETASLEAFDEILRQLRNVDGISSTETSLLLAARKGGF